MKIYLFFIFLMIIFSCNVDVFAFSKSYGYNYEVKNLTKDSEGNITISGWGIINAGVCDKSNCYCGIRACSPGYPKNDPSPNLNSNLGSGSNSSKCTGNVNNKYKYTLYLVPVNKDGKTFDESKKEKISQIDGGGTSLTSIMCRLDSKGKCDIDYSPCYENVGWSFTFNEDNTVKKAKYKNGYIFYLEIYSTGGKHIEEFPLVIYKDRISSNFGSDYYYTDGTTIKKDMKVQVIAFSGYYQKCSNGDCQQKNKEQFLNGDVYAVTGFDNDEQTYFKVGNNLFIPSSWVAPPKGDSTVITPPTTEKEVESCKDSTTLQKNDSKNIKSCSGTATFSGDNYLGCSVNEYDYYKIKCYENNFKAQLSINNSNTNVVKFSLNNGGGFEASAN